MKDILAFRSLCKTSRFQTETDVLELTLLATQREIRTKLIILVDVFILLPLHGILYASDLFHLF
jgi:hypothetical protein